MNHIIWLDGRLEGQMHVDRGGRLGHRDNRRVGAAKDQRHDWRPSCPTEVGSRTGLQPACAGKGFPPLLQGIFRLLPRHVEAGAKEGDRRSEQLKSLFAAVSFSEVDNDVRIDDQDLSLLEAGDMRVHRHLTDGVEGFRILDPQEAHVWLSFIDGGRFRRPRFRRSYAPPLGRRGGTGARPTASFLFVRDGSARRGAHTPTRKGDNGLPHRPAAAQVSRSVPRASKQSWEDAYPRTHVAAVISATWLSLSGLAWSDHAGRRPSGCWGCARRTNGQSLNGRNRRHPCFAPAARGAFSANFVRKHYK